MTGGSWTRRDRAESFGANAEEYDAVRSRYPDEVVAAVLAGDPPSPPATGDRVRVLDVGTGTGLLARAMQAAGAEVEGSEVDAGMAAVAERSGLTVHVGAFEGLELDARFDRVTAAQAWHWVEPTAGLAAVRRLLAPGGQLWLLWNIGEPEPRVKAVVDEVYRRFSDVTRGAVSRGVSAGGAAQAEAFLRAVPGVRVTTRAVPWRRRLTTAEWIRLLGTFSDHAGLDPAVRARLFDALAAAVDATGGEVVIDYETRVVVASGLVGSGILGDVELLTYAEAAAAQDLPVTRIAGQVKDGLLVAVETPEGSRIPALFLQDGGPVKHLSGVARLLRDGGYASDEIVQWLFREDDSLPGTPIEALRSNRATEIKRRAQSAAF